MTQQLHSEQGQTEDMKCQRDMAHEVGCDYITHGEVKLGKEQYIGATLGDI